MTPKEIVRSAFEAEITPWLEIEGFSYSHSQFCYKRKQGEFIQKIAVTLSHHNTQESITFWSSFNVTSPEYNKWLEKQHREPSPGFIGGCMDWNIPGWRGQGDSSSRFDFGLSEERPKIIAEWKRRCASVGLPYLERLSSWQNAAEERVRACDFRRATDFYLIAGTKDLAIGALQQEIANLKQSQIREGPLSPDKNVPFAVFKRNEKIKERSAQIAAAEQAIALLRSEP